MIGRSKDLTRDPEYERWLKSQLFPLSSRALHRYKNAIQKEVRELKALPARVRFLKNKKAEVEQLVRAHQIEDLPKNLERFRGLIWTPRGKGDFCCITRL